MSDGGSHVWVVSELYYPEETSTGLVLTKIAEGLATRYQVRVLCGQPTYSMRGEKGPRHERHKNVDIRRCWGTTWNRLVLPLRLCNLLTLCCSIFLNVFFRVRRQDRLFVVTNPPFLPFFVALACRFRGAKCFLLIHDVYPEAIVAAGMMKPDGLAFRVLDCCTRWLYRSVAQIIVLGRDMRDLVIKKLDSARDKTVIITNWAYRDIMHPLPRSENRTLRRTGLSEKFVVQYSGNMGRTHNLEMILECATRLRHREDIHFVMVGSGAKKAWLENSVRERKLTNLSVNARCPKDELLDSLNACDVSLITFVSGMAGVSVPSRMYNVLAVGKPIIAAADGESELAQVVEEEQIGWVVSPDDVDALVDAVLEASADPHRLTEMGRRACEAAKTKYDFDRVIERFAAIVDEFDLSSPNEPKTNRPRNHRERTRRSTASESALKV